MPNTNQNLENPVSTDSPTETNTVLNTPMSPATRQRKHRLASEITRILNVISVNEQIDVINLSLKQLHLDNYYKMSRKPTKAGHRLTSLETRKNVWDFWHASNTPSTITSRPAKLKVSDKPKIQSQLSFVDTVNIIKQRNRNFYEGIWYITNLTMKELY